MIRKSLTTNKEFFEMHKEVKAEYGKNESI
jgi:hypothetical protein